MAEQSSTVAAFRAMVMLICLVLVPVAAFCGGSFPAVVKAIQSGRWPTLADFRGPAGPSSSQVTEAPRFMPTPVAGSGQISDSKIPGCSPLGGFGATPQREMTGSPVVAANYNAPISTAQLADGGLSASASQTKDLGIGPARRLSTLPPGAGDLLSLDHTAATGRPDAPGRRNESSVGHLSPSDRFEYVQERLRQLGATYYVLETCGEEKREFRFLCKMSIGGNPRVTKLFWCLDGDPLKAMTQVLSQVEDWQSGGG